MDGAAAAARCAALPAAAAVGGAASVGALGERLLEARFDVSALSAADLLKLDYKPARGGGLKVGVAAIFVAMPELTRRCGGTATGLSATLRAFGEAMGVAIVVGMTANDPADGGRKGVVLLPVDPAAAAATAALQAALQAAPAGLPAKFLEGDAAVLFLQQGIASAGFGLDFEAKALVGRGPHAKRGPLGSAAAHHACLLQ